MTDRAQSPSASGRAPLYSPWLVAISVRIVSNDNHYHGFLYDDNDDDDQGMTIQQWACLDGLSKSFKEDNTQVETL